MANLSGLTKEELSGLGVKFHYGISEKLWDYTQICKEEFDLIHEGFGAPKDCLGQNWDKVLDISIGKGLKYVLSYNEGGDRFEIIFESPNEFFGAPLTVTVTHSSEPGEYEHSDWCMWSNGEPQWEGGDEGDADGDEERYIIDENGDRFYESEGECYCEYVVRETQSFVLGLNNEDISLDAAVNYYFSLA